MADRIIIIATILWLVLTPVTISTRWCIFGLYRRPTSMGNYADNLWLVSGRIAWRHYDPAASPYPNARPAGISGELIRNYSSHWFWKAHFYTEYGGWFVGLPLWIPLAPLTLIGPLPLAFRGIAAARHGRRAGRILRGRCSGCNYDLTGIAGDICPECGRAANIA